MRGPIETRSALSRGVALLVVFQQEHAASRCRRQPRRVQDLLHHWTCTAQLGIGWMTLKSWGNSQVLCHWRAEIKQGTKNVPWGHTKAREVSWKEPRDIYPSHEVKTFSFLKNILSMKFMTNIQYSTPPDFRGVIFNHCQNHCPLLSGYHLCWQH